MSTAGEPIRYTYRLSLVALDADRAKFAPVLGEVYPTLELDVGHWATLGRPGEIQIQPEPWHGPTPYGLGDI